MKHKTTVRLSAKFMQRMNFGKGEQLNEKKKKNSRTA